ncbi:ribonuclease 3 [mine drainage metagenome]|uniref:ribonuclease III n=1 Tax=mine drainage metagenome TaxID=410659 RepID=A0A1J5QN29_9ZZZZ
MSRGLDALQSRLGYTFADPALLRQALTHRSYGATNNERLEFLGDSVLNLAVAQLLYAQPQASEGRLSYWRASLVREATLAELALGLELGACLALGEGELRSGGAQRASILADALEAVLGAVLLDGGFDAARQLVERLYAQRLREVDLQASAKDAKTRLQERLQARRLSVPQYTVLATHGPAHAQAFDVQCEVAELDLRSVGSGASRRGAEQQAAQAMIELLDRKESA